MPTVAAPMQGTVVSVDVNGGDQVRRGQQLLVLESLKMEHVVSAEVAGVVASIAVGVWDTVMPGDALLVVDEQAVANDDETAVESSIDLEYVRDDLAEVL